MPNDPTIYNTLPLSVKTMSDLAKPMLGLSPYDVLLAWQYTVPAFEAVKQQMSVLAGRQAAKALTDLAEKARLHKVLGVSQRELRRAIETGGGTAAGRELLERLYSLEAVQEAFGGNPFAAGELVMANRNILGALPGVPVFSNSVAYQSRLAQHALDFSRNLQEQYYTPSGGVNYGFARGFSIEDLSRLGVEMARRRANVFDPRINQTIKGGMAGFDVQAELKTAAVSEVAGALSVLRELGAGNTLDELMTSLDELTDKQWPAIDPISLQRSLMTMKTTARLLNMTSTEMLDAVKGVQQSMRITLGITPEMQALGIKGGGYTGLDFGITRVAQNRMIASATGRPYEEVAARQEVLTNTLLTSQMGLDIRHLAYLREQGLITEDDWKRLSFSIQDPNQAKSVISSIYSKVYGSARQGFEYSRSAATFFVERTKDPSAALFLAQRAAANELSYRGIKHSHDVMRSVLGQAGTLTGGFGLLSQGDYGRAEFEGLIGFLGAIPGGENYQKLFRSAYEARGMAGVRSLMASKQFESLRGGMELAMQRGRLTATLGGLTGPLAERVARLHGQLADFKLLKPNDPRISNVYSFLREANQTMQRGEKATAEAKIKAAEDLFNSMTRELQSEQRSFIMQGGERSVVELRNATTSAGQLFDVLSLIPIGGNIQVGDVSTGISKAIEVLATNAPLKQKQKAIETIQGLPDAFKGYLKGQIGNKDIITTLQQYQNWLATLISSTENKAGLVYGITDIARAAVGSQVNVSNLSQVQKAELKGELESKGRLAASSTPSASQKLVEISGTLILHDAAGNLIGKIVGVSTK